MKDSYNSNILEKVINALDNITLKTDDRGNYTLGFSGKSSPKSDRYDERSNQGNNESAKIDNNNAINGYTDDTKDENASDKREDYSRSREVSLDSQGVLDSIANELTSARLQQAIILSEIVGKPRSKTRRKRRF